MYQALFTPYNVNREPLVKVVEPVGNTLIVLIADVLFHKPTIAVTSALEALHSTVFSVVVLA
jgi:hypothetical protein